MAAAAMPTMQHPITPQAKLRPRCNACCPCQTDFQSDDSIISTIQNEARTASLINWLSSKHLAATNVCTNRLRASVSILNAIRDACREYIESSTVVIDKPFKSTDVNKTIWEDSFPALSSAASTVTPTILFGRKKESDDANAQIDNFQPKLKVNSDANSQKKQQVTMKVKKKIKPVAVSSSNTKTTAAWGNSGTTSVWGKPSIQSTEVKVVKGNIMSLPSEGVELKVKGDDFEQTTPIKSAAIRTETHTKNENSMFSTLSRNSLEQSPSSGFANDVDKTYARPISVIDTADSGKTPSKFKFTIDTSEQLKRLVNIYATILKSQLAPYLLLELHLIVRLVSIPDNTEAPNFNEKAPIPFADVFHNVQVCRDFGVQVMFAIEPIILNLGHDVLKMLVSLDSLRKQCPALAAKMQQIIESNNSTLIFESGEKALGANANTPHLTLPFDHARDSRHNYRSMDRNRLFKEREELRDAFLIQLRAFQDVRGRLMEDEVSSKIIGNIEVESRKLLQGLAAGNVEWFVSFFCDLLLQIGLVPIGETDSDVLNQVADKKRLQKLHKRFTSRGNQTNKNSSSRKLSINQKNKSTSPETSLPEKSFRGHQEFFALFLNAGDSYKFSTRVKQRLSQLLIEMTAVNDTKGLCQYITKMMMLAKFLGLLVFSPNWSVNVEDIATENSVCLNEVPPIDLKQQIETAWKQYRLVVVIPWVVEFLKMMTWDDMSKKSKYYTSTFALLWNINNQCFLPSLRDQGVLQSNMLLVSLQLANLFNDVIGIMSVWDLSMTPLPQRITADGSNNTNTKLVPIDDLPLWFSKSFLFATATYAQDVFELVTHLQSTNYNPSKIVTSSAKKVRPRSISTGLLKDYVESSSWQRLSPMRSSLNSPMMGSPWSNKSVSSNHGSKVAIKNKLVDCFFHQHNDLQQLCETIIDQVIKNFVQSTLQSCVTPMFKEQATSYEIFFTRTPPMELTEYIELLQTIDVCANLKAREEMETEFGNVIRATLEILSPPCTQPKVREMASSLALQHASEKGDQIIRSFVRQEKKKLIDEFVRKESKVKAGVPLKASNGRHKAEMVLKHSTEICFTYIDYLATLLSKFSDIESDESLLSFQLKTAIEDVSDHLRKYFIGRESNPCIRKFEIQMLSLLNNYFSTGQQMPWVLCAAFEAANILRILGELGYLDSTTYSGFDIILQDQTKVKKLVIDASMHYPDDINDEMVGTFFFQLIDGSLIGHTLLEDALLKLHAESDTCSFDDVQCLKRVVDALLNKLAISLGFDSWENDGFVIMVRLQRIMLHC